METREEDWPRFIDTLSHELKTPLTSIIAASGLLEEQLQTSTDEPQRKLIQTIIRNANSLETRLAELLEIVKTGSGRIQLQFEPVDMKSLILGTCLQISPLVRNKEQQLKSELPESLPIMQGDGPRLEQVLLNLLNNATKFTPTGGIITIKAGPQDNGLVVQVTDNGIGIPKDQQDRLFKPYSRINSDRQHHPGLGLGLALSKQVIELHGGKIWVESDTGMGSKFFFFVPLRRTV
ncbi:MAG: HAMP domain-containing sensor histidine kinase [Dehalococcoidales bacterium]|nr:HAMP domain-containing sensor histidine kinase [Dehalococcoidales bacterium]